VYRAADVISLDRRLNALEDKGISDFRYKRINEKFDKHDALISGLMGRIGLHDLGHSNAKLNARIAAIEDLLQSGKSVTVHSRLNDLEKEVKDQRDDYHGHIKQLVTENDRVHGRIDKRITEVATGLNDLFQRVKDAGDKLKRG
jgi:uncharacterized protein YheU (UPF0270 family)